MPLFGRFVQPAEHDLAPLFRALHEVPDHPRRSFSPNFDVRETESSFVLEGELPGLHDKSKLSIEFTDSQTLFIKGRLEKPRHFAEAEHEPSSPRSLKPTVHDETEEPAGEEKGKELQQQGKKKEQKTKVWISERTAGEFQRSFTFPINIDQDQVTAQLDYGILKIVIPKKTQSVGKKIEIQ
jgi:HSP20 family molecular chaperone IbpA